MMKHIVAFVVLLFVSCGETNNKNSRSNDNKLKVSKSIIYALQPLKGFDLGKHPNLVLEVKRYFGEVCVLPVIDFPDGTYYPPRKRYRADRIIRNLSSNIGRDTIIIGLTDKDISTTKGNHKDWGVMGLGYQPGNACVVSTFRLKGKNRSEQLVKVVLHEIGHTRGLPHCPNKTCLMRDAEGGNPLDDEEGFCVKCQQIFE